MPNKGCFSLTSQNKPCYNRISLSSPVTDPYNTTLYPYSKDVVHNILTGQNKNHEVNIKYYPETWTISITQPYDVPITYAQPHTLTPIYSALKIDANIVFNKQVYLARPHILEINILNEIYDNPPILTPCVRFMAHFDTEACYHYRSNEPLATMSVEPDEITLQYVDQLWPRFSLSNETLYPEAWFKPLKITEYNVALSETNHDHEFLTFEIELSC